MKTWQKKTSILVCPLFLLPGTFRWASILPSTRIPCSCVSRVHTIITETTEPGLPFKFHNYTKNNLYVSHDASQFLYKESLIWIPENSMVVTERAFNKSFPTSQKSNFMTPFKKQRCGVWTDGRNLLFLNKRIFFNLEAQIYVYKRKGWHSELYNPKKHYFGSMALWVIETEMLTACDHVVIYPPVLLPHSIFYYTFCYLHYYI